MLHAAARRRAPPRRRRRGRGWWSAENARRPRSARRAAPLRARRATAAPPRRAGRAWRAPRRPCATARAPPRRRPAAASGSSQPTRRHPAPSSAISSPPHGVAVGPVALAVERDAQHAAAQAVLGGDRRDMGDDGAARARAAGRSPPPRGSTKSGWRSQAAISGSIARMRFKWRDRLVAEADRVAVVEIADIVRDERLATARQRDRVLEIGAGGEHARPVGAEVDRLGHEAARAAQMKAGAPSRMRITLNRRRARRSGARGRRRDRRSARGGRRASSSSAISGSPPRLALVATSARSLAASRHARSRAAGERVQDQPVQRRIGEHQRRLRRGRARRSARGRRGCARARSARRDSTQRALRLADLGEARRAGGVGHHHGERLGLARLAPAQPRHRRFVARVADQMEAAEALERDDAAGAEAIGDVGDLRVEPGAAFAAGDRLGVEAAVCTDRRSRARNPGTSGTAPSTSARGRRAARASACSAARNGCS